MKRFESVDDQTAAGFPVRGACEAVEVSTSGYYDWAQRRTAGPTGRELAEAELVALMRRVFDDADGNYGVPRMYKALRKAGLVVNKKRVVRLMGLHGMAGRFRRRKCRLVCRTRAAMMAPTSITRPRERVSSDGPPGPFAPMSASRARTRMPELKVAQGAWFDEDGRGIMGDSDAK